MVAEWAAADVALAYQPSDDHHYHQLRAAGLAVSCLQARDGSVRAGLHRLRSRGAAAAVTPAEVREMVVNLSAGRYDPEAWHETEDAIHQAVLEAIAEGRCADPAAAAREALATRDIQFPRWCA